MMAIPDEYKEIIETLAATSAHRIEWQTTVLGMELVFAESSLELWKGRLNNGRACITFGLSAPDGETLDTWAVDEYGLGYDSMLALFSEAKRQVLNIPQRLAKIRDEINRAASVTDDRPPPPTPPRHTAASDCDASLPSAVTMR